MIYSAITGNKDKERYDNIPCFGNQISLFKDECRNAKVYKILSHHFVLNSWSIWIDGNITLKHPPEVYLDMLEDKEIGVFKHFERNCIYDEGLACQLLKKDDSITIERQMEKYRSEEFPRNYGLGCCNIIVRKHTPKICLLNNMWWSEICVFSRRDQLSFPYIFRDNIKYFTYKGVYRDNEYYRIDEHNYGDELYA
jgi:hypothetical protein